MAQDLSNLPRSLNASILERRRSFRGAPDHPVDSVSWEQAMAFCQRLGDQSGYRVRLPSETEWEYACRVGTSGDFYFGDWGKFQDDSTVHVEPCVLTQYLLRCQRDLR